MMMLGGACACAWRCELGPRRMRYSTTEHRTQCPQQGHYWCCSDVLLRWDLIASARGFALSGHLCGTIESTSPFPFYHESTGRHCMVAGLSSTPSLSMFPFQLRIPCLGHHFILEDPCKPARLPMPPGSSISRDRPAKTNPCMRLW